MFMQAGFAVVETGLCRAKNANHTFMMNFMVYGWGLFAYWVMGFALQQGGSAGHTNLGGLSPLNSEFTLNFIGGKPWGLFGQRGFFLSGGAYDVGIAVWFMCQMVFMDTAATIVTGAAAERWKFLAFSISTFFLAAIVYPLYGNWAWGGGWLSKLGANYGVGHGYCDFAGSGVVHTVGGMTALAVSMIIGPRIGKYTRTGKANPMPGHDMTMVLIGCFILAFGWFGFNPGSTLGASGNGNLRIGSIAVNTMLAGGTGSIASLLYMWIRFGKPDASMAGNGMLAGLVPSAEPWVRKCGGHHLDRVLRIQLDCGHRCGPARERGNRTARPRHSRNGRARLSGVPAHKRLARSASGRLKQEPGKMTGQIIFAVLMLV